MRSTFKTFMATVFLLSLGAMTVSQDKAQKPKQKTLDDIRATIPQKAVPNLGVPGLGGASGGGMGSGGGDGPPGGMSGGGSSEGMSGRYPGEGGSGYGGGSSGGESGSMGGYSGAEYGGGYSGGGLKSELQAIVDVINQLRGLLDSKKVKREETEVFLRKALQAYFVAEMKERVKEFDKVKARVMEMETKLQRRLDREEEIIDLQLKQMIHKADGLDFFVPKGSAALGSMGGGEGAAGYGAAGFGEAGDGGMGEGGMSMGSGMGRMGMAGESGGGMPGGLGQYGEGVSENLLGYDATFGTTNAIRSIGYHPSGDPLTEYSKSDLPFDSKSIAKDEGKLKAILLAMHHFLERFHHFPCSAMRHSKGQPPHSWRVAILPCIGRADLYRQYNFDEPWDSEGNLKLVDKMPAVFRGELGSSTNAAYYMLVGDGTLGTSAIGMRDIADGSSNTIGLIKSERNIPWTKPEDISFSAAAPMPQLSPDRLVGFLDGVVGTLPANIPANVFRAMATIAGGEVFSPEYAGR